MDGHNRLSGPPSHKFHTRESRRNETTNGAVIGHVGGGHDPYSVSISPIIKTIWLLKSLTFDPPLWYNPQNYGSLGHSASSLSSDAAQTSTNEKPHSLGVGDQQMPPPSQVDHGQEHKRHAVSQQPQAQNPPTIATGAAPYDSSVGDLDDASSNARISPSPGSPSRGISADAENQPSQDLINTLDKGGHLRHSHQDPG